MITRSVFLLPVKFGTNNNPIYFNICGTNIVESLFISVEFFSLIECKTGQKENSRT